MTKTHLALTFMLALGLAASFCGCGSSDADSRRSDSLLAAADTLEYAGYGALGTGAEIETYYIEALSNCREAERLGADTDGRTAHLEGNLRSIRSVLESQITLAEGMPSAKKAFERRIARIDSAMRGR